MKPLSNRLLPASLLVLAMATARAALPPGQAAEIDHLLNFVRQSTCRMERNGELYGGATAADHIERKFDYFRDEIDSTERFIELSATRSVMSGEFYTVLCDGADRIRARDWLLRELGDFRRREKG